MITTFKVTSCINLAAVLVITRFSIAATTRSSSSGNPSRPPRCKTIDAAFTLPDDAGTFFLSGGEFIEYSFRYMAEKRMGSLAELGITQSAVQAAFSTSAGDVIILEGCSYHRYNGSQGLPLQLVETKTMDAVGLPCDVDAAISWTNQILVFQGCNQWKWNDVTGRFAPHGLVTSHQLPCDVEAALEGRQGVGLFLKGHRFWKVAWQTTGPHHADNLHICSWYLCGEADWMWEESSGSDQVLACNGDSRLCPLRLDQVTLAGLHNAGSGFYGGFGLFNCWLRNHGLNITRQLELGIRHLDIDPCFETCGLLGTCHTVACGGSLCMMIKQIRHFLRDHRHDVITLNFNHEIVDARLVFRELTRQLKVQLRPLLNDHFRRSGNRRWPTLRHSVLTNQRVFVLYAPIIENPEHVHRFRGNRWIHSENVLGTTWRPFSVFGGCDHVVNLTASRCSARQHRQLVEVCIIPEMGRCISSMADSCRPYLHDSLRACQPYRFRHGKSPNVLLVDWPEIGRTEPTSVFQAVYHQNVRNIAFHRRRDCQVSIDAAVTLPGEATSLLFVGTRLVEYDHGAEIQTNVSQAPAHLQHVDAAYTSLTRPGYFHVIKGCRLSVVRWSNLEEMTSYDLNETSCIAETQAAVVFNGLLYTFHGCAIHQADANITIATSDWGLPCYLDAAMTSQNGRQLYFFKGNNSWKYNDSGVASYEGSVLNWNIDAVTC